MSIIQAIRTKLQPWKIPLFLAAALGIQGYTIHLETQHDRVVHSRVDLGEIVAVQFLTTTSLAGPTAALKVTPGMYTVVGGSSSTDLYTQVTTTAAVLLLEGSADIPLHAHAVKEIQVSGASTLCIENRPCIPIVTKS